MRLQVDLGLAELRELAWGAGIALAVGLVSVIVLLSSIVVLMAWALAPLFAVPSAHLFVRGRHGTL
jgi:hypothetical protein